MNRFNQRTGFHRIASEMSTCVRNNINGQPYFRTGYSITSSEYENRYRLKWTCFICTSV